MSDAKCIALTFDVEFWHETDWLQPYIGSSLDLNAGFEHSINNVLALLGKYGRHATFFVTEAVARSYPELIQTISQAGHEIASHGIGHARLPTIDPEAYGAEFKNHIDSMEALIGKKVKGFRAPHFSLTDTSKWLIPLLESLGFQYDSSIMPSAIAEYGHPDAPRKPYMISSLDVRTSDEESRLLEIPVSVFGRLRVPFAGGIYFRFLPLWIFRLFLGRALKQTYPPVIYFHPHELDTETPRITRGPWLKRYIKYFGVKRSLQKFEKILRDYECDSIERIFFR